MPLLIGFLLWPIVEIWLLIEIGGEIGAWATIGWILATAVAGGLLLRHQGAQAMTRIRQTLADAEAGDEASGAALAGDLLGAIALFFAAICLILPGFLTDTLGILLLLPILRRILGRGLWGWLRRSERVRVYAAGGGHPFRRGPRPDPTIIEGEYRDLSEPPSSDHGSARGPKPGQDRLPTRAP
ncbi:MAG: FxsA family protein [Alphaproteobacteria bacterium]